MLALELDPLGFNGGVGHDHGIAGEGDPAGNAVAHGNAQAFERAGILADGDDVIKVVLLLVDEHHGPAFVAEELGHFFHDVGEHHLKLEGGGEGARDIDEQAGVVLLKRLGKREFPLLLPF